MVPRRADRRRRAARGGPPRRSEAWRSRPDTVWTERVTRAGISATKFCVRGEDTRRCDHAHDHDASRPRSCTTTATHGHSHVRTRQEKHHHVQHDARRHQPADRWLRAESAQGRTALSSFSPALGEAEAAIHGTRARRRCISTRWARSTRSSTSSGRCCAMEHLGSQRIVVVAAERRAAASIRSAHGVYPVPAPATLRLLEGRAGLCRAAEGRDGDADRRAPGHELRRRVRPDPADARPADWLRRGQPRLPGHAQCASRADRRVGCRRAEPLRGGDRGRDRRHEPADLRRADGSAAGRRARSMSSTRRSR